MMRTVGHENTRRLERLRLQPISDVCGNNHGPRLTGVARSAKRLLNEAHHFPSAYPRAGGGHSKPAYFVFARQFGRGTNSAA